MRTAVVSLDGGIPDIEYSPAGFDVEVFDFDREGDDDEDLVMFASRIADLAGRVPTNVLASLLGRVADEWLDHLSLEDILRLAPEGCGVNLVSLLKEHTTTRFKDDSQDNALVDDLVERFEQQHPFPTAVADNPDCSTFRDLARTHITWVLDQLGHRAPGDTVEDGFGSEWVRCSPTCDLEVVRPGKAQCSCDTNGTGQQDG